MNNTPQVSGKKPRVEYVDLVKGFCMLFIMAAHCELTTGLWINDFLRCMRLPSAFFTAALFFKAEETPARFFIRKTNLLVIPWAFFLMLSLVCYTAVYAVDRATGIFGLGWESPLGPHTPFEFFAFPANVPIWSLWCIFFTFAQYYCISWLCRGRSYIAKVLLVLAVTVAGLAVDTHFRSVPPESDRPVLCLLHHFHFFSSMVMLPFMLAGETFKKYGLLWARFRSRKGAAVLLLSLAVWLISSRGVVLSVYWHDWPVRAYIPAFSGILAVTVLAAMVGRVPLLNFIGNYSLTALSVHYIYFEAVSHFTDNTLVIFPIVLALTLISIRYMVRYFPSFTGQRNLIPMPEKVITLGMAK